jgi:hypothetical protein
VLAGLRQRVEGLTGDHPLHRPLDLVGVGGELRSM